MWYKTGTVTYKAGSALITGKNTLWADDKMGITPGDLVLISIADDNVMMAEIKTVNSNTEIELRTAFNKDSVTDTEYAIINTLNETIADFAKRISAAIAYFNKQAEGIQDLESRVQVALKQYYSKAEADGRYYTKAQSDNGYAAKISVYTKGESDSKYIPKGGNLQLTGNKVLDLGVGSGDIYLKNGATNKYLQLKDDGRLTYSDQDVYHTGRKPSLDELNAASQDIGKRYVIDTRGLNKDWFYPIQFNLDQTWNSTRLSIKSTARGGTDPFNQNSFIGFVQASGWSDTPQVVSGVLSVYDYNERTLGGIFAGSRDFYGFVVYVRGDNVYHIESQTPPILHKAQVSLGTAPNAAVFPVGPVTTPTNANLLVDLKTSTDSYICNRSITSSGNANIKDIVNVGNRIQLESKANNTLQLAIGDNDSGFGFRADGAVNLWSNSAVKGYFDPNKFVYYGVASTHADSFRAVYGNKGFIFRQDGANMYFLLSHTDGGWGGWTGHRPITINMTDGATSFGCPTHLNGATYYNSTQYWKRINGAGREANLRLWGSGARETVLEWGWEGLPYGMYLERNTGLANNQSKLSVNGQITGQVVNASDERLKHSVTKVDNALETVEKLNGYTFMYNGSDVPSAGVIAQELLGVYDNAVFVGNNPNDEEDEEDYYTVDYNQLHALHIEAIKELSAQNRQLKADNETLRTTLELLQSNVKGLIDERVQVLEMKLDALYNDKMNGVSTEAPPINNEETP
ncbi:hypothetical protein [Escherichia phage PJNS034]